MHQVVDPFQPAPIPGFSRDNREGNKQRQIPVLPEQYTNTLGDHIMKLLSRQPTHRHDQHTIADPHSHHLGKRGPCLPLGVLDHLQARRRVTRQQRLELFVFRAQRQEIGVLDRHDPPDQVLEMMGHHLRVNGFGAQPSCITPVDGCRDIGQLQPDPQRRFLTVKQRIQTTAKIGRLPGEPGVELIVQSQNCEVTGAQTGSGREPFASRLPTRTGGPWPRP